METSAVDVRGDEMAGRAAGAGRGGRVAGLVLISLGLVILVGQLFDLGLWTLPILAAGFLAAGAATRQAGWLVPAGVLGGISLGAWAVESGLASGDAEGGLFLLCFALGWASIHLLSQLLARTPQRWALIPAGVMALIGGAVLMGEGGERFLELVFGLLNVAWPLALVVAGALMLRRGRRAE